MLELLDSLTANLLGKESSESSWKSIWKTELQLHESGGSSPGRRKRQMEEMEQVDCSSPELPLFIWKPCLQSQMISLFPPSVNPQYPHVIADWSLNLGINTSYRPAVSHRIQSLLMDFLQKPHCTDTLKRSVNETLLKWLTDICGNTTTWGLKNVDEVLGYPNQSSKIASPKSLPDTIPSLASGMSRTSKLSPSLLPSCLAKAPEGFMQSSLSICHRGIIKVSGSTSAQAIWRR